MAAILVVEDNDDVREMLTLALELGGRHTVWTAANGADALARLRDGVRPALILFDLMMPVMSGWDFRAALLKDPRWSAIPVVVISALAPDKARNLSAGYLPKPVDIEQLLEVVENQCRRERPAELSGRALRPSR